MTRHNLFLTTLLGLALLAGSAAARKKKLSLAEMAALEWKLEQGSQILTTNPDVAARQKAVSDLAGLGDPRAVPALATALREDPDPKVRKTAAEALAALKTPEAKGLLTVASTSDPEPDVRQSAKQLLAKFPRRMMVATVPMKARPFTPNSKTKVNQALLRKLLARPSGDARLWAVKAMRKVRFKGQLKLVLHHMERDPSPRVRVAAATLLADVNARKALPYLIKVVEDGNPMVRFEVARLLAQFDDAAALRVLQRVAQSDPNAQVKAEATDLLEPTTKVGRRLLKQRIRQLSASSEAERIAALQQLATTSHWRAMRPMACTLLNDPSPKVRASAAGVLAQLHDSTILTALRVAAVLEPDPKVKKLVRKQLVGLRRQVDGLIKRLQAKEPAERALAARFLGQAAYPPGLKPLIAALKDKQAKVRRAAAKALTNFSNPEAAKALKVASADSDKRVRQIVDKYFKDRTRLQKYRAFFRDSNRVVMKTQDKLKHWRSDAAIALGVSGAASAVGTLAQLAQHDKDPQVRLAAAWSLVLMASDRAEKALKNVAAKDKDPKVRLAARRFLIIDKVKREDLVAQLSSKNPDERRNAAEALSLRPRSVIMNPMIKTAVCDPNAGARAAALRGLARIGNPLAKTAIRVAMSRDPSKSVRRIAYMTYILAGGK